jgi:hypothetical protein
MSRPSPSVCLWILAFAVVLLSGLSFIIFTSTRTRITGSNGYRIRPGMTLAEVEEILGGPPRIEGNWPLARMANDRFWDRRECSREGKHDSEYGYVTRAWYSDAALISVAFEGERVTVCGIMENPRLVRRIETWLRSLLE